MAYGGQATLTNDGTSTSIITSAFDVTPTSGSLGYVVFGWSGAATLTTVVDSTAASWTIIGQNYDASDDSTFARAYRENISGSPTTVTGNLSGSSGFRRAVAVWHTGVLTSGALDKSARQSAANTTATDNATSTATATLAQADELVLGGAWQTNTTDATFTAGTGYTERAETTGSYQAQVEDKTVAATTAVAATWTCSATGRYSGAVDTFKIITGPPPEGPHNSNAIDRMGLNLAY